MLVFFGIGSILISCQLAPAPIEEYSLARAAIEAARGAQAPRYSPGYWSKAEEFYRRGRAFYKEQDYPKAFNEFVKAREQAESAENSARLLRQQNGEI